MSSSSFSSSRGEIRRRCRENSRDLVRHAVGDLGHLLEHRPQLGGYRRRRVPPLRRLRHVLSEVAHPFQIGGDVQRGDDRPQVGSHRRLPGDGVGDLGLDLPVDLVHLSVAFHDRNGCREVRREQRGGRFPQRRAYGLGHRYQQAVDLDKVGLELLAHAGHARPKWRRRRERW
jgi:hypothetical protein